MPRKLLAILVLALVIPATPAYGYDDVGHDPDDRRAVGEDPDIKTTRRVVWRAADGRRRLKINTRAYEPFGLFLSIIVRIDSRAGPRPDFIMRMWNFDNSGRGCDVHPRGHPHQETRGRLRQRGNLTACRVLLSTVRPTKRARWRLFSPTQYPQGENEYAPNDRTFYP